MKIPDYISPVMAHRVWRWDDTGLKSLNGEPWLPDRPVEARCRVAPAARHVSVVDRPAEVPNRNCTCGLYAAKNLEHLRQLGYASYGVCGEVYLWGIVVEHRLGWRAQFAYPKSLGLPLELLPFTLAELNARLQTLIAFGTDISVLRNGENIRLWKHAAGYDGDGLDYIINLRQNTMSGSDKSKHSRKATVWHCWGEESPWWNELMERKQWLSWETGWFRRFPAKTLS